ncbi:hypothetical protein BGHDH14_bgh02422 [Blumeria hordei DH14]|uniref:EKA-like protein n=1 Tax=Blumeria graminis f. sp. hordei (strain DH14) TaxID=546991 RepID=N1JN34_BLUG1|nr:hypothetical protein BGHDH14_bgh02422 [Blumeria hordei DH14]
MLDNTTIRPRALDQTMGLAQNAICVEMSKATAKRKKKAFPLVTEPNTDMIGSVEIDEKYPQSSFVPHGIGESPKPHPTASNPLEKAAQNATLMKESQPQAATNADCPPELRPIIEAEQRRAAETAANLALCSAASPGVEATLLSLTNGSNRIFVDSMRVYLCAAIAQYMTSGLASMPPVLSPRPANPILRAPDARSTLIPAVPVQPSKSTSDIVVQNRLLKNAVLTVKHVPQPVAMALKKKPLCLAMHKVKIEPPSGLSAGRVLNITVKIKIVRGYQPLCEIWVVDKFKRVTGMLFCPRFRPFDESGIATIHKPRRSIEQCAHCLGFYATRVCSRAPACWNRGSNMDSETGCKFLTRCRNCGSSHT